MCDGWRGPCVDRIEGLQNRPLHLVRHMKYAAQKATEIPLSSITKLNATQFTVASASKDGVCYELTLGNETETDRIQPSCQCFAFRRCHLPCKHFAALFLHSVADWNSLPNFYRNNPLFAVDKEVVNIADVQTCDISSGASRDNQHSLEASVIDCISANANDDISAIANDNISANISENSTHLATIGKQVRDILCSIQNVSYIVLDKHKLERAREDLQTVYKNLLNECPNEGGLLLECDANRNNKTSKCESIVVWHIFVVIIFINCFTFLRHC